MNQSYVDVSQGENAFGRSCAKLRKRMGLSQRELGRLLEISEQAVGQWERGKRSPTAQHLKRLLALALQHQAFLPGQEYEEAKELWLAAGQPPTDFETFWVQAQLAAASARSALPALVVLKREAPASAAPMIEQAHLLPWPRLDWGDALSVPALYGREVERAQLEQWVLQERCQVVSVLGMGGIGKSALAVTFMHQVSPSFEAVVFRSLRDAPPCQDLLADCLHVLSPELLPSLAAGVEQRLDLLLQCLQARRCLLVLDNLETLLQAYDAQGHFRAGYEDYAVLLERVAQTEHQSCLLLTSRELPVMLDHLESRRQSVRTLRLLGLEPAACEQLLEEREVIGSRQDYMRLAQWYAGNPLALNIVAESICELFGGQISTFLEQDAVIFSSIRDLLAEQWSRLSATEQALLCWMAIVREAVTSEQLHTLLVPPVGRRQVGEALEALQRRSLVERAKVGEEVGRYTLHSVVLEYVTELLVERVSEQIQQADWEYLISYALEQASAKEYVRQAQERLLVAPILLRLQTISLQADAVEQQLLRLLGQLRTWEQLAMGYGPANLLMLLRGLRGHLRGLDLSGLAIRGAYLQGVQMQDARLSGANLCDTLFTEAFDAIWVVAVSPGGRYWAAGSKRGEVRVWREGGQILHLVWQGHTDTVMALAFSPNERHLVSGSWDGHLKLWDLERGSLLWDQLTSNFNWLAIAPDGSKLANGGDEGLIHIWDVTSGTLVQRLSGQGGAVHALAWSSDGKLLASSGFDGRVRVWEIESGVCMQSLEAHNSWVTGLAFAPNGTRLASAGWDRTVRLWDLASGRLLQTLLGHTDRVLRVAWSPDGRTLASAGFDKTIWLWDVKQDSYHAALHGHSDDVYSITFTADSGSVLSGSQDGTVRVWDRESGQCVRIIRGYAVSLYDVDWSPDGRQVISGGSDRQVTIWDTVGGGGRMPPKVLHGHSRTVNGVAWSPDGQLLASAGWDNTIRLWNATTGACLQLLRDPDAANTLFQGVAWSPDGRLLASGSYLRGVQVWDVAVFSRRWVGHAQSTKVRRVAWSPDGTRLASCGDDGSICLWNGSDGTLLGKLQGHSGVVASVAWSPDGTQLASGGAGQEGGGSAELFVWDVQRAQCVLALSGHVGIVFAVAWSKDGELLVSGGSDGVLRWWNVRRGECVRMREAHHTAVQSLRVSPDGHLLASCGDDNAINIWDLYSAELLRTLRGDRPYERLNITGIRGLTEAQKETLRALGAVENEADEQSTSSEQATQL